MVTGAHVEVVKGEAHVVVREAAGVTRILDANVVEALPGAF